jgi:hypothetical protein
MSKWTIGIALVLGIISLGMIGGQKSKGARRFGIPGLGAIVAALSGVGWRSLAILLFMPILVIGYGENSWLMGVLHSDTLVRIVYAILLALPFFIFGVIRFAIAAPCLIVAFSIQAGSLGSFGGFDFLIEDIIRYGMLGILIFVLMILWKR